MSRRSFQAAVLRCRHRHRARGGVTGQQGFALLATLAVIGLTSVIILAVLSLSYTTTAFSADQVQRDRATRAGDSALRTAVDVLAREATTAGVAGSTDPCQVAATRVTPAGTQSVITVDGQDVVVTCAPQTPDRPPVATQANSEQVRIVGNGYRFNPCDPANPGTRNAAAFSCLSELSTYAGAAAFSSAQNPTNGSTLLHSGPGSLTFTSDVSVKKGAAGVRNPAVDLAGLRGPAFGVSGVYQQGNQGFGGTASRQCGVQSRASDGTDPVWIDTVGLNPRCSSTQAAALSASTSGLTRPVPWTNTQLSAPKALPACGAQSVIVIPPGVYGPTQTATLNQWFGTGACNNKVFLFTAGDYYFDVDNGSTTDPFAHALTFDDPTSVVVFGNPDPGQWNPGDPATTVDTVRPLMPDGACVPGEGTGVTITLSSWTSIQHKRGRVAVCDQRSNPDQPVTAIWQTGVLTTPYGPALPTAATDTPPGAANPKNSVSFSNVGAVTAQDGNASRATAVCDEYFIISFFKVFCYPFSAAFTVGADQWGTAFPATTSDNPVDSVTLAINGSSGQAELSGSRLVIQVSGPNLAQANVNGLRQCTVTSTLTSGVNRTVDLLDGTTGDCVDYIRDTGNLRGASVRISFLNVRAGCRLAIFGYNLDPTVCNPGANDRPWVQVDSVNLSARLVQAKGAVTVPFRVTSDVQTSGYPTTSTDASFNVFGRTSIPLSDLDVRWNGTPTTSPVFGGSLVVGAIASSAPTTAAGSGTYVAVPGTLCCTRAQPSERVVNLNAWVDLRGSGVNVTGRLAATARVAIQDWVISLGGQPQFQPGNNSRVDAWQLCASRTTQFVAPNYGSGSVTCPST